MSDAAAMRLLRRPLVLAALALALVPAAAAANPVVSISDDHTVLVRSTADEANRISTVTMGNEILIHDLAAPGLEARPPCTAPSPGVASCPADWIRRIQMQLGPGDDIVDEATHHLREEIWGEAGADVIHVGPGGALLDGGAGSDELWGNAGSDTLRAEDGSRDAVLNCGGGSDDLDADPGEPGHSSCEIIAPEPPTPILPAAPYVTSTPVTATLSGPMSPGFFSFFVWNRCDDAGVCTPITGSDSLTYAPTEFDIGRRLRLDLVASNRAGTKTTRSATSPTVSPVVVGYTGPLPVAPTQAENLARWSKQLTTSLRASMAALGTIDPRRLARRNALRVRVALPWPQPMLEVWPGPLRVYWTATPKALRSAGIEAKGRKPVRLAFGSTAPLASRTTVDLKLTRTGRRALNRAKRLKIDVGADIAADPNLPGITARHVITLKRRR